MERLSILVALLAGGVACESEKEGRADTIPLLFPMGRVAPGNEILEFVEDAFGLQVIATETGYGAIQLYLYEPGPDATNDFTGYTYQSGDCAVSAWALRGQPDVVAHEIGHGLGLSHTGDDTNLMFAGERTATGVTEEQLDTARRSSWVFEECRKQIE